MTCLDNLVYIKSEGGTAPANALPIERLPGIALSSAFYGMDKDKNADVFAMLQDKIDFAKDIIKQEISVFLSAKLRISGVVQNETLGYYKDNLPELAAEDAYYKGIQIQLNEYPYLELFVSSISLQTQYEGEIEIKVFDLITGKEIDSFTVDSLEDEITVLEVNKTYPTNNQRLNLLFAYNTTGKASYKSTIHPSATGCRGCGKMPNYKHYVEARGAKLSIAGTKVQRNIKASSDTAGLSINYSLQCSTEPLVCQIANRLSLPMLYKTGVLIMEELKHSKRFNAIITIGQKSHEELAADYDAEYIKYMNQIVEGFNAPNDICFKCKDNVRTIVRIP